MTTPTRHAVALALSLLLGHFTPASAQAQSYTATLLNRPSGATSCHESQFTARLSDNGDVATTCAVPKVTLASIFGVLAGGGAAGAGSKAVVWRAGNGTARTLGGTLTQTNTSASGILSDGTVVGYAFNDNNSQALSAWKASTRAAYALPSGYSSWFLGSMSPGGKVQLLQLRDLSPFGMSFALVSNGVAKKLPPPPSACGVLNASFNTHSWAINNVGQMALLRSVYANTASSHQNTGTLCLWTGNAWVVSGDTPNYQDPVYFDTNFYDLGLLGLSDSGQVLLQQVVKFTWAAGSGFQQVDPSTWAYGADGDVLGGASPTATSLGVTARLWRQGQLVELGQLATAPTGYQLSTALATNARGQVLVLAQSTRNAVVTSGDSRLVLLTPR